MPIGLPCPARFLHFCHLTDGHPIQQCAAYVDSAAPRRHVSFRPWTYPRQHGSGRDLAHSPSDTSAAWHGSRERRNSPSGGDEKERAYRSRVLDSISARARSRCRQRLEQRMTNGAGLGGIPSTRHAKASRTPAA